MTNTLHLQELVYQICRRKTKTRKKQKRKQARLGTAWNQLNTLTLLLTIKPISDEEVAGPKNAFT